MSEDEGRDFNIKNQDPPFLSTGRGILRRIFCIHVRECMRVCVRGHTHADVSVYVYPGAWRLANPSLLAAA